MFYSGFVVKIIPKHVLSDGGFYRCFFWLVLPIRVWIKAGVVPETAETSPFDRAVPIVSVVIVVPRAELHVVLPPQRVA